jgi:hypothetical protein
VKGVATLLNFGHFWPGCTGANPGYSMVNVGRRAGKNFRNSFLSNYLSQPLDIWYTTSTHDPIPWDLFSGLSLIHFLFIDLVKFSTLMVNNRKFS